MDFIQDIDISISVGTLSAAARSFDPLVLTIAQAGSGIALSSVTSLTDLTGLGYTSNDPEYNMVAAMLSQDTPPSLVKVYRANSGYVASGTYVGALTALRLTDDSWYHVLIDSRAAADLNAVGTWAGSNNKFFYGCSSDVLAFANRNADRETYLMHTAPADYPECAWVGKLASKIPGTVNWKWKVLAGQIASTFTSTQLLAIRTAKCAAIQSQAGLNFTNNGQATSGVFISTTHGKDYIQNQIEVEILSLMINTGNVPLDANGISAVESVVRNVLHRCGALGLIAAVDPASQDDMAFADDKTYKYKVTTPQYADLSTAEKTSGDLAGLKFVYYQALGINSVKVTGYITA